LSKYTWSKTPDQKHLVKNTWSKMSHTITAVITVLILIIVIVLYKRENLEPLPQPKIYFFYDTSSNKTREGHQEVLDHAKTIVNKHKVYEVNFIDTANDLSKLSELSKLSKLYNFELNDVPGILIIDYLGDILTATGAINVQNVLVKMDELGKDGKIYNLITYIKTGEKTQKHHTAVTLNRRIDRLLKIKLNSPRNPILNKRLVFLIKDENCIECDVLVNHFNNVIKSNDIYESKVLDIYYDEPDVNELMKMYDLRFDTASLPVLLVVDRDNRHKVYYGSYLVQSKFMKLANMSPYIKDMYDMLLELDNPGEDFDRNQEKMRF